MQDSVLLCTFDIQISWKQNRALYFQISFWFWSLQFLSDCIRKTLSHSRSTCFIIFVCCCVECAGGTDSSSDPTRLSQLHEVAWHVLWDEMLKIQSSISEYERYTYYVLLVLISGILFWDKTGFLGQGRLGGAGGEWATAACLRQEASFVNWTEHCSSCSLLPSASVHYGRTDAFCH